MTEAPPVVVEFLPGSRFRREAAVVSPLPVLNNGLPGSFVELPIGIRVSLPTDQIVMTDETAGAVRVGFGGMRFTGTDETGLLTFQRERDVLPPHALSPERGQVMKLRKEYVTRVEVDGRQNWPG